MTEKMDPFGIREGEVSAPLPEQPDASLYFIGRIRTPWKERKDCPKNARESREGGVVCTIELDPRWAPALKDIETCTHLVVLYWMDRSRRDLVVQVPGHYKAGRGTFALRSPVRPNPIAMSVVKLVKVEGTHAFGDRRRLPRRHPAARSKALFRLRRLHSRTPSWAGTPSEKISADGFEPFAGLARPIPTSDVPRCDAYRRPGTHARPAPHLPLRNESRGRSL